jgi:hypothetical protein
MKTFKQYLYMSLTSYYVYIFDSMQEQILCQVQIFLMLLKKNAFFTPGYAAETPLVKTQANPLRSHN